MSKSFKQKTLDEKLTTLYRQNNIIMKVLGVKDKEPEEKKLVIDEEKFKANLHRRRFNRN